MKELSMFEQCGLTLEQVERFYNNYKIAFVFHGDFNEYHIESEGAE